jgi:hypothetical protein
MPIPASQLETWSHQGAITTSAAAYNSIQTALAPLVRSHGVEIFLQGSYGNSTNIYGDSDVDVVVLYENTFHKDMSKLTPTQQQLHEIVFPTATYQWSDLQRDVLAALRSYYGNNAVKPGSKAIKVETGRGSKPSDVIPAVAFRQYATFTDQNNYTGWWGIQFFDSSSSPIINYPKRHIKNGEDKNQATRTSGQYKATIRIFKNFRSYLVDHGLLADGIAPSYFIECALHNVPDNLFVGAYTDTIPAILNYFWTTPFTSFMCQNGVTLLIGNGSTQWPAVNFTTFLTAAIAKWNNW